MDTFRFKLYEFTNVSTVVTSLVSSEISILEHALSTVEVSFYRAPKVSIYQKDQYLYIIGDKKAEYDVNVVSLVTIKVPKGTAINLLRVINRVMISNLSGHLKVQLKRGQVTAGAIGSADIEIAQEGSVDILSVHAKEFSAKTNDYGAIIVHDGNIESLFATADGIGRIMILAEVNKAYLTSRLAGVIAVGNQPEEVVIKKDPKSLVYYYSQEP